MAVNREAIRKIGFNKYVRLASRELHVQTEVLLRDGILVKTTVLEGGTVLFTDTQACPAEITDVREIEAYVAAQHHRNIAKLISGAVD